MVRARSRWVLIAAGSLLVIVALLGLAQLILPGIAAQQLRDRLSRSGKVLEVEVSAFPAIELLWHEADRVVVRMASYTSSAGALQSNIDQVADVGSLDASAERMTAGLLTLRDARLQKRGGELTGEAMITEGDLRASLPVLDSVAPVSSGGGELTLQGTATLFGVTATVDATVRPDNGALIVTPDVPFGALATITLFSNPSIRVQGVSAAAVPGGFEAAVRASVG